MEDNLKYHVNRSTNDTEYTQSHVKHVQTKHSQDKHVGTANDQTANDQTEHNTQTMHIQKAHVHHDHPTHDHSTHDHLGHAHVHTHKNTKVVLDRLSRASGHLESVKRMIVDGKDCSEVLIQLSAVIAALNNAGKVILKDHIENCIVEAVETKDQAAIDNLNTAIDRFIK